MPPSPGNASSWLWRPSTTCKGMPDGKAAHFIPGWRCLQKRQLVERILRGRRCLRKTQEKPCYRLFCTFKTGAAPQAALPVGFALARCRFCRAKGGLSQHEGRDSIAYLVAPAHLQSLILGNATAN